MGATFLDGSLYYYLLKIPEIQLPKNLSVLHFLYLLYPLLFFSLVLFLYLKVIFLSRYSSIQDQRFEYHFLEFSFDKPLLFYFEFAHLDFQQYFEMTLFFVDDSRLFSDILY